MIMNIFDIISPLPFGIIPFSHAELIAKNHASKELLPQNAAAVIVILFPYYLGEEAYIHSNISRYAVPLDYHDIVSTRLSEICEKLKKIYPDNEFRGFCDNSPIAEKKAASLAGLGVIGKNSLLINESYGSYCFIGDIVTDAHLDTQIFPEKNCINCGNCINACPSAAIGENVVDVNRCVSAISQKKGELSPHEKEILRKSGSVWGCDRCQTSCPMNNNLKITPIKEFCEQLRPILEKGDSMEGRAYSWRGAAVIERNISILDNMQ